MRVEQQTWTDTSQWKGQSKLAAEACLVFLFGGRQVLEAGLWRDELRKTYPNADWFGCSTAGEICDDRVYDDTLVATAVAFEHTKVEIAHCCLGDAGGSTEAGAKVAQALPTENLVHVFVLSVGVGINGSELVRGMLEHLPDGVQVTGGLAGDGARFETTLVFADGEPRPDTISAIGFYGDQLTVGYGSLGGWDTFGPMRKVTRSESNILYELDGKPALELYKTYLGDHAKGLPATGLLFPLYVRRPEQDRSLVRTILGVDEDNQSMTFAGDVPEGSTAQLMKANFDRLVDGAADAARASQQVNVGASPDLAILISCVGRKLVLRQRTEEEVESVREVLGDGAALAGFYSYGEICPAAPDANCDLHNQTMTITTFSES